MSFRLGIDATALTRPHPTGVDRYAAGLVAGLAAVRPQWDLQLATWRPVGPTVRPPVLDLDQASLHTSRLVPRYAYRLAELARLRVPFDLATGLRPDAWLFPDFVALPLRHRVPSVVVVHDLSFDIEQRFSHRMHRSYLRRSVARAVASTRIAAVSTFVAKQISERYGVPLADIVVARSGIDHERFHPPSADDVARVRSALDLPRPYVLSVGALHARKNLLRLISAFGGLGEAADGVDLVLAGPTNAHSRQVLEAIEGYPGPGRVRHLGFVPERHLAALYGASLLTAVPSSHEGFGLPVTEAMACGSPVLAARASALPEAGGDAAAYVDPASTEDIRTGLAALLSDAARRADMTRQGLERVAGRTWESAGRLVAEALER